MAPGSPFAELRPAISPLDGSSGVERDFVNPDIGALGVRDDDIGERSTDIDTSEPH